MNESRRDGPLVKVGNHYISVGDRSSGSFVQYYYIVYDKYLVDAGMMNIATEEVHTATTSARLYNDMIERWGKRTTDRVWRA